MKKLSRGLMVAVCTMVLGVSMFGYFGGNAREAETCTFNGTCCGSGGRTTCGTVCDC